jgi:hypothetical protein
VLGGEWTEGERKKEVEVEVVFFHHASSSSSSRSVAFVFFILLARLTFVLGPARKLRLEILTVALTPYACEVGELVCGSERRGRLN